MSVLVDKLKMKEEEKALEVLTDDLIAFSSAPHVTCIRVHVLIYEYTQIILSYVHVFSFFFFVHTIDRTCELYLRKNNNENLYTCSLICDAIVIFNFADMIITRHI